MRAPANAKAANPDDKGSDDRSRSGRPSTVGSGMPGAPHRGSVAPRDLLQLQRSSGNRAVQRLVERGDAAGGIATDRSHGGRSAALRRPMVQRDFTVSAVVSASGEVAYPMEALYVDDIRMPEGDRPETQYGALQMSHAVAWTGMVEYWRKAFTGPLSEILPRFMEMAGSDQRSDENDVSRELRSQAVYVLREVGDTRQPLSEWQRRLNLAVSLYVQAYQASSFATHGKKPGGRGEGTAKAKLAALSESSELATDFGEASTVDADFAWEQAQKLLDVSFRLPPDVFCKAYDEWVRMVTTNYAAIGEELAAKVLQWFAAKPLSPGLQRSFPAFGTLGELLQAWRLHYGSGKEEMEAPEAAPSRDLDFVVHSVVTVPGQDVYQLDAVQVADVYLSEGDRPETQFGRLQKSHAVAWTVKIIEWRSAFRGPLRTVLERLAVAAENDQATDTNPESLSMREHAFGVIRHYLAQQPPPVANLSAWTSLVNQAIKVYVDAYQLASTTTHADKPGGRGEAAAKVFLADVEGELATGGRPTADPGNVVKHASWLIDAPLDKPLDLVCHAYDGWLTNLGAVYPSVMTAYGGAFDAYLASVPVPVHLQIQGETNLGGVLAAWRRSRVVPRLGLPSGAGVFEAEDVGDPYAPSAAQDQYLNQNGLALVRIKPDGDCLYYAIIRAGLNTTVEALRNAVADRLEATDPGEGDYIRQGGWAGPGADLAPGILAAMLGLELHVVHPNAFVELIGDGPKVITLVLVEGPPQHYHLAE